MLNVIDEFTRECVANGVERKLKAVDVIDVLSDLFILRGIRTHIRSDNGPEFIAKALREWIAAVGPRRLIRPLTDQNPLAHSLRPIDMTRHGWLSSRRQASQQ